MEDIQENWQVADDFIANLSVLSRVCDEVVEHRLRVVGFEDCSVRLWSVLSPHLEDVLCFNCVGCHSRNVSRDAVMVHVFLA